MMVGMTNHEPSASEIRAALTAQDIFGDTREDTMRAVLIAARLAAEDPEAEWSFIRERMREYMDDGDLGARKGSSDVQ